MHTIREADTLIREACVGTYADIDDAARNNADRIELCSRLDIGGLTPAAAMVEYALSKGIRVAAMIRRREGFSIGEGDMERLKEDIRAMIRAGADGLVFGYLAGDGLDFDALNGLLEETHAQEARYGKKEKGFHMAFDGLSEAGQFAAIDALSALGFDRILTKGGKGRAEDNIDRLKRLNDYARGKIILLCGGGVTDANYERIARQTGITQFHGRKLARR